MRRRINECARGRLPRIEIMLKRAISQFALLCLVLNASAAAQSVVPDSASAIGAAKPGLFDRVISNQKKNEEALDIYERIERLEVRKKLTIQLRRR